LGKAVIQKGLVQTGFGEVWPCPWYREHWTGP